MAVEHISAVCRHILEILVLCLSFICGTISLNWPLPSLSVLNILPHIRRPSHLQHGYPYLGLCSISIHTNLIIYHGHFSSEYGRGWGGGEGWSARPSFKARTKINFSQQRTWNITKSHLILGSWAASTGFLWPCFTRTHTHTETPSRSCKKLGVLSWV